MRRHTQLPIGVGFGIRDAKGACEVAEVADAVVIGSALVESLKSCTSAEQAKGIVADFLGPIRQALDADLDVDLNVYSNAEQAEAS